MNEHKRIKLTHGTVMVNKCCSKETLNALDEMSKIAYKAIKEQFGCYIMTKGEPLNKYEQMICRIFPDSLYAESLWYKANGRILGQVDENGNMKPFTVEL